MTNLMHLSGLQPPMTEHQIAEQKVIEKLAYGQIKREDFEESVQKELKRTIVESEWKPISTAPWDAKIFLWDGRSVSLMNRPHGDVIHYYGDRNESRKLLLWQPCHYPEPPKSI